MGRPMPVEPERVTVQMQQGFPADVRLDEAVATATANALRHYPAARVGEAIRIDLADGYLVQVDLTGDVTPADLTDPETVRQGLAAKAKEALAALDDATLKQVFESPEVADRL